MIFADLAQWQSKIKKESCIRFMQQYYREIRRIRSLVRFQQSALMCNVDSRRRMEMTFMNSLENRLKRQKQLTENGLFPSDIVARYYEKRNGYLIHELKEKDDTLEELWKALPDYVCDDSSTLVVRDGSGSMCRYVGSTRVTALEVATALTIYFAERCKGQYFNKFITFIGFNPAVYHMVLSDELDPYKCLLEQICSKRYDAVEEALAG